MSNEMTQVDIDQLKAELAERQARVPALRDEVKRTKEYGDLSENDEYRCAKREYNRNKSRMRYLERTIENAVVIRTDSAADEVGLFDWVDIYYPEDEENRTRMKTVLHSIGDTISEKALHRLLCDNRRQLSHRRIFAVSPAVAVRMRALRARRQPSLARRHLACRRTL